MWIPIVLGALLIVGLVLASAKDDPATRTVAIPASLQTRPIDLPKLALISANCTRDESSYLTCEGFVQNISPAPMENVTAVLILMDDANTPLSSEHALIDYDPLLPNQSSPFKVLVRMNPAFTQWRIEFQELLGGQIKTRDDSH